MSDVTYDLLDRADEAHYLARAVDDEYRGPYAMRSVVALDTAWRAGETCGLVEDDADTLGLTVFAAYVTALEGVVDAAWCEYADTYGETQR